MQLAWSGGLVIVDPLACDIRQLARLLDGPGLAVLHAAQQDLDVLTHACGTVPSRLFDTQLAAGFLGYSTPSLSSLVSAELQIHLPKGDRLTDWLRRPLTSDQREYAASDVEHLFELHDRLSAALEAEGRLSWAEAACEELRVRPQGPADPDAAWLRLKDTRTLKARNRGRGARGAQHGASGGRRRATSRPARSCPISRCSASPRRRRAPWAS